MANAPHTTHNPANPPPNAPAPGTPRDPNVYRDPNAPHDPNAPNAPGGSDAPYTSYPGGMASDPIAQLASEISTNIKGLPERIRGHIDSTPALKAMFDQYENDLVGSIAQSIRRVVDVEVAKVTGGIVPGKAQAAAKAENERRVNPSA